MKRHQVLPLLAIGLTITALAFWARCRVPTHAGRIDDLWTPAAELIRLVPGVATVECARLASTPKRRIIHIRDWHVVSKERFAIELKADGSGLNADELDRRFQEFLLEVELVQLEQMAVIRCLIEHHGLKRVYAEGFTPEDSEAYRERVKALRLTESHGRRVRVGDEVI